MMYLKISSRSYYERGDNETRTKLFCYLKHDFGVNDSGKLAVPNLSKIEQN